MHTLVFVLPTSFLRNGKFAGKPTPQPRNHSHKRKFTKVLYCFSEIFNRHSHEQWHFYFWCPGDESIPSLMSRKHMLTDERSAHDHEHNHGCYLRDCICIDMYFEHSSLQSRQECMLRSTRHVCITVKATKDQTRRLDHKQVLPIIYERKSYGSYILVA